MSAITSTVTPNPNAIPSTATGASGSSGLTVGQAAKQALEAYKVRDNTKGTSIYVLPSARSPGPLVRFKSIGAAPIMKNNVFKITGSNRFQAVIVFLRGQLGLKEGDPLFTYINGAFAPAPDDPVMNLYKCFGTEGHLIVNYSNTQAWS